jgi:heme/copper-type cytochrome/quinol oxidase subunit 4
MWIYVCIFFLTLFVIYKERQALGCPNVPDGSDCNNKKGKAVKGTRVKTDDNIDNIFHKLKKAGSFADRWVVWRLGFIIGITSTLICFYLLKKRFPTEWELIICLTVISTLVYFSLNFYNFHLFQHIKENIERGVELLKSRFTV